MRRVLGACGSVLRAALAAVLLVLGVVLVALGALLLALAAHAWPYGEPWRSWLERAAKRQPSGASAEPADVRLELDGARISDWNGYPGSRVRPS